MKTENSAVMFFYRKIVVKIYDITAPYIVKY